MSGKLRHILYADHDSGHRRQFSETLASAGYRNLTIVDTAERAISEQRRSSCDVVVVTQQIQRQSGVELARALIAEQPDLPVLFLCNAGDERSIGSALALGNVSYAVRDSGEGYLSLIPDLIDNLIARGERRRRQRETEASLEENERKLRQLIACSPVCIHEIDLDGRLLSMNPAGLRMMGASGEQEIIGLPYLEVTAPEDRESVAELLDRAKDGEASQFEFRAASDDGILYFASSFVPVRDDDGSVARLMGITQNITDAKIARLDLIKQLKLFRETINAAPIVVTVKDRDQRFVFCNRFAGERWGFRSEDVVGRTLHEVFDQGQTELRTGVDENDRHVISTGQAVPLFEEAVGEGSFRRRMLTSKMPIFDESGQVEFVVTLAVDISERTELENQLQTALIEAKRAIARQELAEEALRGSEELLRAFLASSPDAATIKDLDGRILVASQEYATLANTSVDELLGKTSKDLFPEQLQVHEALRAHDREALKSDHAVRHELEILTGDGKQRTYIVTKFPILNEKKAITAIGTTSQDVTELRQIENQLRQAQKMEAVGQLTGGVAHDFNNLLGVILGNLELALERLDPEGEQARRVERAVDAARRGASLTHRLLAFSRKQALRPRGIPVEELIDGMHELLDRTLGETIDLEVICASDLWLTEADPAQLENAILNLAINARDAMTDGGKLVIEASNVALNDTEAAAQAEVEPGDYVVLAVSDSGIGIVPELLDRVFEPFFTSKEVGRGSGLGLSMVLGFVRQSGGYVTIYSEVGEGTTVKLYMPRYHGADSEIADTLGAMPPETPHEGEVILVVEDDADLRALIVAMLESLGYGVLDADIARAALDIVASGQRVDLLLTDIVLPGGMSGRELSELVQRRRPGLPTLFMSGYSENSIIHHGRLDDNVNLLQKPFRKDDIARAVRELLARREE